MTPDEATLYLSFTFSNTGSRDWPVRNLRVVAQAISHHPMSFKATHYALPGSNASDEKSFPHGFLVPARGTVTGIYEFVSDDPVHPWTADSFEVTLLVQPGRSGEKYVFAGRYPIKVDASSDHSELMTRENADEPDPRAAKRQMPFSMRNRFARLAEPD